MMCGFLSRHVAAMPNPPTFSEIPADGSVPHARIVSAALLCIALVLPLAVCASDSPVDDRGTVTIYRCTDAQGRLSLRDSPCPAGNRQTARSMQRPQDAPTRPRATALSTAEPVAAVVPAPQIFTLRSPRPLYECVTPEGERYSSDTPEGNPRRVPAWALGYLAQQRGTVIEPGSLEVGYGSGGGRGRYSSGSVRDDLVPTPADYGGETWVRDACHPLPQAEVCARLRERRDEIGRRSFNAQPSDRERLERERRGVVERMTEDCR